MQPHDTRRDPPEQAAGRARYERLKHVNVLPPGRLRVGLFQALERKIYKNVSDADVAICTKATELASFKGDRAAAFSNRGALNFQRANYNAAIADSSSALALDRSLVEAMVNRGASYLKLRRPSDAEANFSRALAVAPAHAAKIHFNRAMAREDMGDRNGAYADYARAARLAPQWDQPRQQLNRFTIVRGKPMS